MLTEQIVTCPSCWQQISLLVDLSAGSQDYIEDCSVCCHPLRVMLEVATGELLKLEVECT